MMNTNEEIESYRAYLTLANYKLSTVKAYCRTLAAFFIYAKEDYSASDLDVNEVQKKVQAYLLLRKENGLSWSSINADYSALRKYFKMLKDLSWSLKKLPRPKRDRRLPEILSKEEVAKLIQAAPNLKYQVFLTLLYSTGIRLSEACHLKLNEINADRMQIKVQLGKGGKDRYVQIPEKLLILLRQYYKIYRPKTYLFNGRIDGLPYSSSAGQWSIRRARKLAGIDKKCSIHTLRNCYATHHLELGTDLVYLQEQLGHKHLKTTAKYIRLCIDRYRAINHPIDVIQIHYRLPMS